MGSRLSSRILEAFTTEEEDDEEDEEGFLLAYKGAGAMVLRVASAITCNSGCRPDDETPPRGWRGDDEEVHIEENQRNKADDDIVDYAPNVKLRLLNLFVGIFQFITACIIFGLTDPDKTWAW